ncbi:MAG: hypothetical protein IIT98_05380 [Kiritimatiellae bacterium]|nr:hypothetical protein [Kiritimatiellia bacterium]
MKKLAMLAAIAAFAVSAQAQSAMENDAEDLAIPETTAKPPKNVAVWPAFIALCEWPETPDLIGLRITIPFSTVQENVTGFDIGFWGRARYFEGLQFNVIRNDASDRLCGLQVGLYNTTSTADTLGIQAGLWNEAGTIEGGQCGLVNTAGMMNGVQFGLINRAETLYGFQIGVVNVIRSGNIVFCPVVNVGF